MLFKFVPENPAKSDRVGIELIGLFIFFCLDASAVHHPALAAINQKHQTLVSLLPVSAMEFFNVTLPTIISVALIERMGQDSIPALLA